MKKPSADDLAALVAEADLCFSAIVDSNFLEQEKSRYLGKNGALAPWLTALKDAPPSERQNLGAAINRAKQSIEEALKTRREFLQQAELQKKLQAEAVDVTLPGRGMGRGGLHPITQAQERIALLFHSLGFVSVDGPEIETDDYNFTALNTPQNHPARSMQDTFYLRDIPDTLLRTHTSPVQIRAMRLHRETHRDDPMPDLRILASGRVYRVDSDATHSPMFHQVEGLWVGEKISFADLKGMMVDFLRTFFDNAKLQIRFRPSYFPFTEPSAEIDMAFQSGGWLEIAGCGMVHPQVLRNGNIDPQCYSGVAFGAGLERLTMLRHAITDLRHFYTGDLSFLNQFH